MAGTRINSGGNLARRAARGNARRVALHDEKNKRKDKEKKDIQLSADKTRNQNMRAKAMDINARSKDRAANLKMKAMEIEWRKTPGEKLQNRVTLGDKRFVTDQSKYTKGSGFSGLQVNGKDVQTRGRKYNKEYLSYAADKNKLYYQNQDTKKAETLKGINATLASGGTYKPRRYGGGSLTVKGDGKTPGKTFREKGGKERSLSSMNNNDLTDILAETSASVGAVGREKAQAAVAAKGRAGLIANQKAIVGAIEKEIPNPDDPMGYPIPNPEYAAENQKYLRMLKGGDGRSVDDISQMFGSDPGGQQGEMMSSHQQTDSGGDSQGKTVADHLNSFTGQPQDGGAVPPPAAPVVPAPTTQQPVPVADRSGRPGVIKQSAANEWAFDAGVGALGNLTWGADNLFGGKGMRMAGGAMMNNPVVSRLRSDFKKNRSAAADRGARARKLLSQN